MSKETVQKCIGDEHLIEDDKGSCICGKFTRDELFEGNPPRKIFSVMRWIFLVWGAIEVVFGTLGLVLRSAEAVSTDSTGASLAPIIFWLPIIAICLYFEKRYHQYRKEHAKQ